MVLDVKVEVDVVNGDLELACKILLGASEEGLWQGREEMDV